MQTDEVSFEERLLASTIRYLLDGDGREAAALLLPCSLGYTVESCQAYHDNLLAGHWSYRITLRGPRYSYSVLSQESSPVRQSVLEALGAVIPDGDCLGTVSARAEVIDVGANWRSEMREITRGSVVSNQVADAAANVLTWNNLRFRSESERRIAIALDRAGVFFLPNCKGRLGVQGRKNREADFLVCHRGRWGILEVDGEPFHPPSRKAQEDERDRDLKLHGMTVVEHYDASRCFETPDRVVQEFLAILLRPL